MAALLSIAFPDITGYPSSSTTTAVVAGDSSLTVKNGAQFLPNQLLVLNGIGNPVSQIVAIANSVPGATSIPLAASFYPILNSPANTTLQVTPYNQVEIEYSDDFQEIFETGRYTASEAATLATWVVLDTISLQPANATTYYQDSSPDVRSYRTRYYNSVEVFYSDYGAPILPDGYKNQSVGYIIQNALENMNKDLGSTDADQFTIQKMLDIARNGMMDIHDQMVNFSFDFEKNYQMAQIEPGQNLYNLPPDMNFRTDQRSTLNVRVADQLKLTYIDADRYNWLLNNVHRSPIASTLTTLSATVTLEDSSNFPDSGTIIIATGDIEDSVNYTANDRTTGVLTLESPSGVTTTHAIGTVAWNGTSFGEPRQFTMFNRKIALFPVPPVGFNQRNITIDYYKAAHEVTDFNDYVPFSYPMVLYNYICMTIAERIDSDSDVALYESRYRASLKNLLSRENNGQYDIFRLRVPYNNTPLQNWGKRNNN